MISYTRQGGRFVIWALDFMFSDITYKIVHETKGAIRYGHWVLRFVISLTRQGAIRAKLWVLRLMISYTKQGLQFVTDSGFCVLCYRTRDRRYDLLRAMGSTSYDITYETRGKICYGQ